MDALSYQRRRLTGVRSTWLVLLAVLLADAAVAAVTARQPELAHPVRVLTAAVPQLPLPLAALGAGLIGALAHRDEARDQAVRPQFLTLRRRFALLFAKSAVVGACSAVLAGVTLALNAGVYAALLHRAPHPAPVLAGYVALVLAGGWIGLLASVLLRSAAAGVLVLATLPLPIEPVVAALRGRLPGQGLTLARLRVLWPPAEAGHAWLYGPLSGVHGTAGLSARGLALLVAGPVLLLLLGCLVLLPIRRAARRVRPTGVTLGEGQQSRTLG